MPDIQGGAQPWGRSATEMAEGYHEGHEGGVRLSKYVIGGDIKVHRFIVLGMINRNKGFAL
ncbi:MAG: hypothetical protein WCH39_21725 [Schlesneria sp.]